MNIFHGWPTAGGGLSLCLGLNKNAIGRGKKRILDSIVMILVFVDLGLLIDYGLLIGLLIGLGIVHLKLGI